MTAQEIIDLRKKMAMSQEMFAQEMGVPLLVLETLELGTYPPSPWMQDRLNEIKEAVEATK